MLKNSKWRSRVSDNPCSSSSEDDYEYSDPLEVAASAGGRLSTPEKSQYLSEKNQIFMIRVERDAVLQKIWASCGQP